MKIGILSDTHDNVEAVGLALHELENRSVELILHCGDIESPSTAHLFSGIPTHFVFGNCDWRPEPLAATIKEIGAVLYLPFGELELDGKHIAWIHSHDAKLFQELEQSGRFDYLFYGHTHRAERHRTGKTLVVNPGALYRVRQRTCIVVDLSSGEIESVAI